MKLPPGLDLTRLVTLKEAGRMKIGLHQNTMQGWQQRGLIKPVGIRRHPVNFLLNHTYRLGALIALQEKWLAACAAKIPRGYISASEAAVKLHVCHQTVRKMCRLGTLKAIQLPACNTRESWWVEESSISVYKGRLAAEEATGNRTFEFPAPAGYLSIRDLQARSGLTKNHLNNCIARGKLKAKKHVVRGIGVWIVSESEATRFCGKIAPLMIAKVPDEVAPVEKPLLAADHAVCLQARRELWERNGRVFRASRRNALVGRQRAG
jgi:hypothetical protein